MSLITYLTRVHFADRVLEDALGVELLALGAGRPLIITDLAGDRGDAFDRVIDALPLTSVPQACRGVASPADVTDGYRAAAAFAAGACDAVIGLGGAAALDLARLIGQTGGDVAEVARLTAGNHVLGRGRTARCPVVALPVSTESVGLGAAVRIRGAGGTANLTGISLLPGVVLCDPTLTLLADPAETAAAGMDALTHCIEAYLGTTFNPPADGIALEGVRRAGGHLARAVADGNDLEARREMLAAALNAGLAAQKGLGGVHALAHALEAEHGAAIRHGWMHAALLQPVLAFNAPAVADRFAALRAALDLPPGADLPQAMTAIGARVALPLRLTTLALDAGALLRVAQRAEADPANQTNPRLATATDYLGMLEHAI